MGKMNTRRLGSGWLVTVFVLGIVLLGGILITGLKNPQGERSLAINVLPSPKPTATPTPFPFVELTIEHLRNREFKSQLGELKLQSENGSYQAYITSYSSDGLRINGLLTRPAGEVPAGGWPAVVFVHGYIPPDQYRTEINYASYVDYLARNGLVVFKIDLRGHDRSEGEPGGAYYSEDYVVDTLNARAALAGSDFVNPEKIGLWGHSMAGNIVFRSFVAAQDIPAIVVWSGAGYTYSDISQFGIDDNSYRPLPTDSPVTKERNRLRELYNNFDPDHWFWKQVTPENYLDGVKGAMQVHHAVDDKVVSVEYGRNLKNILAETGIGYELIEHPSGGHNLTGNSFNQAMQGTVEFFKKNLK